MNNSEAQSKAIHAGSKKITAKDIYARGYAKNAKNSPTFKDSLKRLNNDNK